MIPFATWNISIMVMAMLMLAANWLLTAVRHSLPSFQRSMGALIFSLTALIASQVVIPLEDILLINPFPPFRHWELPGAATIVIALALVLAGVTEGLLAAAAVIVLAYIYGGVPAELVFPIIFSIVTGLVVRRFWGLQHDFITARVLLLLGLCLSLPQVYIFLIHPHGRQSSNLELYAALLIMAAYPVATLVIGNLFCQPYHQMMLENQLLESQERNRQMVQMAGNAIVNFNANLEVIDYNEEAERVFGYPRQFVIGRRHIGLLFPTQVWPEILDDAQRVLTGAQVREHEVQVQSRDGELTPMIWSISRITDARGESLGLMAIGQDISQRKRNELRLAENEERVRLALSGADLGMWDWNIATDEVKFSERWASMLGYTLEELQAEGLGWDERIHPEDRDYVMACMEEHLSGRTEQFEVEHRLRRRDGEYIWVLSRARVIQRDDEDRPLRMTGTLLDISQRVANEQERRRLEGRLRHSQKMETIGTLAGGIAHDFNNILQGIMGYTTLGSTRLPDDHPVQQDLERVIQASERARGLVDQMLVFSRQTQQSLEQVDVEQVCREALRILGPRIDAAGNVQVELDMEQGCPALLADPTQIHQVVMNLLTNALQSMKDSGGTLRVELRQLPRDAVDHTALGSSEAPESWVSIRVSDTGCGIDPANISRLYEPFFTTKSVDEGTGLGLSVVHGIVTSHGGSIEVESEQGQGSSFTVCLPVLASIVR